MDRRIASWNNRGVEAVDKLDKLNPDALRSRVSADMADIIDEEIEMEIDDDRLDNLLTETSDHLPSRHSLDRHIYFKELFRLQGELVKKSQIPYKEVTHQEVVLPPRIRNPDSRKRCTSRIGTEEFGASQPLAIHLTECGKQVPPR